jgi:large subunit ribosomal protein L30e
MTAIEAELKTALRTGKVVLGAKQTIKHLKLGTAKAAIVAANAPPEIRRDVLYYARLSGIPVYVYPGTSRELGTLCAKPFVVSALAVIEEGDSRIVEAIKAESRVE